MMKNTLGDLNNLLFAQLEKLGDDDLNGEEMDAEIRRAETMVTTERKPSRKCWKSVGGGELSVEVATGGS